MECGLAIMWASYMTLRVWCQLSDRQASNHPQYVTWFSYIIFYHNLTNNDNSIYPKIHAISFKWTYPSFD